MALALPHSARERVAGWIADDVERGMSREQAANRAIELAVRAGIAGEVLRAMGADLLLTWIAPPDAKPPRALVIAPRAPRRRVDPKPLRTPNSLLECLVKVDGRWLPLGDLIRVQCARAAESYRRAAARRLRMAGLLDAVAERLPGSATSVREHFDEKALRALAREVSD